MLSVGKELVDIDRVPGRGQVYDINSYALAAAAKDAGADVRRVGIVEGNRDASVRSSRVRRSAAKSFSFPGLLVVPVRRKFKESSLS